MWQGPKGGRHVASTFTTTTLVREGGARHAARGDDRARLRIDGGGPGARRDHGDAASGSRGWPYGSCAHGLGSPRRSADGLAVVERTRRHTRSAEPPMTRGDLLMERRRMMDNVLDILEELIAKLNAGEPLPNVLLS